MNYLLASHGNRILFFLQKYFSSQYTKHLGNGSILKLTLRRKFASIEMIYSGYTPTSSFFKRSTFPTTSILTKKLTDLYVYRTVSIYIVRHGIAQHNVSKDPRILLRKDTHLVGKGKSMLRKSIPYLPAKIDGVFASPLVRTRETIQVLLEAFPNRKIYIVPTANEILFRYFPFLNAPPNIPARQNKGLPSSFQMQWKTVPRGRNMIDEILHCLKTLKIDKKTKNKKKSKKV